MVLAIVELKQEEDIRNYIEARLKQKGVAAEREVVCGNGVRADLVTSDTVIEVKKQLNRGAIYQAHGQGVAYQKLLNKPKLMIIGLAPASESRYQEAKRIAANIQNDDVEVVFIDKDPKWGLAQAIAPVIEPKVVNRSAQLPFDQSASAASKAAKNQSATPESDRPASEKSSGVKDIWILLLIILGFIWIKLAAERHDSPPQPPQPSTEITVP